MLAFNITLKMHSLIGYVTAWCSLPKLTATDCQGEDSCNILESVMENIIITCMKRDLLLSIEKKTAAAAIEKKTATKLFGVHIDETMSWDNQISHIITKVQNGLRMLYKTRSLYKRLN